MFKLSKDFMMEKYETGKKAAETAIDTAKDITLHKKVDAVFEVRSKKQQKNLFGMNIHFDKEISLFKAFIILAAVIAGLAFLSAAFDALVKGMKGCCSDADDQ